MDRRVDEGGLVQATGKSHQPSSITTGAGLQSLRVRGGSRPCRRFRSGVVDMRNESQGLLCASEGFRGVWGRKGVDGLLSKAIRQTV